jgi:lipopolysaccharide export system protein LptA
VKLPKNNIARIGPYPVFVTILLIVSMTCPMNGTAQNNLPGGSALQKKKLDITSDRLVANQNSLYILFAGNVKAIYGEMKIASDDLKVFYTKAVNGQVQLNRDSIDKIIASGHVIINFDNKTAECENAVYNTKTNMIILTGDHARVLSGKNYITGEKITICQNTGQITVDGNTENRVNAVFNPENADSENARNGKAQ